MDWIATPEAWIALLTLTVLEIVLGIDNIIFISILSDRLPEKERGRAQKLGLAVAMLARLGLLFTITWIMRLTEPLFGVLDHQVSGRDLILIAGGLFLLGKATVEIHDKLEGPGGEHRAESGTFGESFAGVILQIFLLDVVFSLDSVVTAVGMADDVGVMATAIVIAVGVMMAAAGPLSAFVSRHPTVKILALSFLLLIGMSLVAEGLHQHIPKGYIYFAMGFSVFVEMVNLRATERRRSSVDLRAPYEQAG